ncbi:MAG TPA: hypothetical protein VL403_07550, partial [Candidatus Kryptonia bacterium]|nr:hypothetical protein [Candidatus Kryptonia bacterium]
MTALAGSVAAQIDQIPASSQSNDGTLYVIERQNPSKVANSDGVLITTLVGTTGGQSVFTDPGSGSGTTTQARAETVSPLKLFDINNVSRTGVLSFDASSTSFDPTANGGKGVLCLNGTGGATTCTGGTKITRGGGSGFETVFNLTDAGGSLPAGSVADVTIGRAYVFGAGGPSTSATLCGSAPSDGLFIPSGDSVVVIYNLGSPTGFSMSAAGFTLDTVSPFNSTCPSSGGVIGS